MLWLEPKPRESLTLEPFFFSHGSFSKRGLPRLELHQTNVYGFWTTFVSYALFTIFYAHLRPLTTNDDRMTISTMEMPRYRYAIGQAPVRFPSPSPNKQALTIEDKEKEAIVLHQSNRMDSRKMQRWSIAHDYLVVPASQPIHKRETNAATSNSQDNRRRTKSMYIDVAVPELSSRPSSSLSRRSSTVTITRIDSRSRVYKKQPDENIRLCGSSNREMSQCQARPASASISCSSRPNSLFWTASEVETAQSKMNLSRSYGSTETATTNCAAAAAAEDPYGYRALAGPSLLPSFHEQQLKQQKEREVNSRTCGPNIAMIKSRGWTIVVVAGVIFVLGCLLYVLC